MGKQTEASKSARKPGVSEYAATYVLPQSVSAVADALFTQTQQRVLGLVFGQPNRSFTVSEVIAASDGGSGAIHRELRRLADTGLVTTQHVGNQKRYQADPASPVFDELVGIIQKTVGMAQPLRDALAPIADRITHAFVYGSVAKRSDTASSDIDLMVISDTLAYADVFAALEPAVQQLGRPVNPTVYSWEEMAKRVKTRNAFVTKVLEQPKIWLIGEPNDLSA